MIYNKGQSKTRIIPEFIPIIQQRASINDSVVVIKFGERFINIHQKYVSTFSKLNFVFAELLTLKIPTTLISLSFSSL